MSIMLRVLGRESVSITSKFVDYLLILYPVSIISFIHFHLVYYKLSHPVNYKDLHIQYLYLYIQGACQCVAFVLFRYLCLDPGGVSG